MDRNKRSSNGVDLLMHSCYLDRTRNGTRNSLYYIVRRIDGVQRKKLSYLLPWAVNCSWLSEVNQSLSIDPAIYRYHYIRMI